VIVVDANVLIYWSITGPYSESATRAHERDSYWVAPMLWRSEYRNALVKYVRHRGLQLELAVELALDAELVVNRSFDVASSAVLELSTKSGRSAYDCEYVALARMLGVPLVTSDRALIKSFPDTSVALEDFGR
jgi:predicted nucleic acid-binding protein